MSGMHPDERLNIALHFALLGLTAWACLRYRQHTGTAHRHWHTLVAALLVVTPLGGRPLPERLGVMLFGTEGVTESVTEGILLALAIAGVRERAWWIALPAAVLCAEELDWGFLLLPTHAPEPPAFLHSRSDRFNFHNSPLLYWLWKPPPMLGVMLLSLRPWPARLEAWLERLRVPRLRRDGAWGIPLVVALCQLTKGTVGHRFADEAMELGLVSVVLVIWARPGELRLSPRKPA